MKHRCPTKGRGLLHAKGCRSQNYGNSVKVKEMGEQLLKRVIQFIFHTLYNKLVQKAVVKEQSK